AGIGGGTTVGLGQARALAADGPGAGPLALEHTLGDGDLLALGGLVGVGGEFLAAEALPGGLVELEAAVVAVAGVDRPVAAGLALGDLVPDAGVRLGDAGSGGAQARCHHGAAGGGGHLRGDPCAAEVDRGAVGAMGGDSSRCGHRYLLGKGRRETGEGRRCGPTSRCRPQPTVPARPARSASSMPIQRQYLRKLLPNPSNSRMTSMELLSTSRFTSIGRRAPAPAGSRYAPRVLSSSSLSTASVAWRVLAVVVCVAVLGVGGLTRSNDLFPFGVLDQFSTGTDPDGEVV